MQTKKIKTTKNQIKKELTPENSFVHLFFSSRDVVQPNFSDNTKNKIVDGLNSICFPTQSKRYTEAELEGLFGGVDFRVFTKKGITCSGGKTITLSMFDISASFVARTHRLMIHFEENETKIKIANFCRSLMLKIIHIVHEEMHKCPISDKLNNRIVKILDDLLMNFSPEKINSIQTHWRNIVLNEAYSSKRSLNALRIRGKFSIRCYKKIIEASDIDKKEADAALSKFKQGNTFILDEYKKYTEVENSANIKISFELALGGCFLLMLPFPLNLIGMCMMMVCIGYSYWQNQTSSTRKMNNVLQSKYSNNALSSYSRLNTINPTFFKTNSSFLLKGPKEIQKLSQQEKAEVCALYTYGYYYYLGGIVRISCSLNTSSERNSKPIYTMRYFLHDSLPNEYEYTDTSNARKNYPHDKKSPTKPTQIVVVVNKDSSNIKYTPPSGYDRAFLVQSGHSLAFFNLGNLALGRDNNDIETLIQENRVNKYLPCKGIRNGIKFFDNETAELKLGDKRRIEFSKRGTIFVDGDDGSKKEVPHFLAFRRSAK